MEINTLEKAIHRIIELEKENQELKEELNYYKTKKSSGRQKHNEKWTKIYNAFVLDLESGLSVAEIAKKNGLSERTMYRYKAYYDKVKGAIDEK